MINRREILTAGGTAGAAALLPDCPTLPAADFAPGISIIDTNVSLFRWPFRRLPLDDTESLVKKLRSLGIVEAWAGSFEAILHRDLAGVNQRLADTCKRYAELIPFGSVNPTLPDWQDDLRRCLEAHKMSGIRLYPNYHGYRLNDSRFMELVELATAAGTLVQIAALLEDPRTQQPMLRVANVDLAPLPAALRAVPGAKVQLLNYWPRPPLLDDLLETAGVFFDTARVEGTDGVPALAARAPGRLMFGSHAPFLIPDAALIRTHESSNRTNKMLPAVLHQNARRALPRETQRTAAVRHAGKRTAAGTATRWGLPPAEQLRQYRIWDSYFTPSHSHPGPDGSRRLIAEINRSWPALIKAKFEKLCYFAHVGTGTTSDADFERLARADPRVTLKVLERWPERLLGMIQLNANDVPASLDALQRWVADGPMLGVYFPGGGPGALTCTHRNFDPLIQRIIDLRGVIMQHTWFRTGGKAGPGASTPAELAQVAARFPEQKFICAHAGGEWERGLRAVRDSPNILVETSGFDATAGFIDMAVRDLGPARVIFGSHLPSRSLGTELAKVLAAEVSEADKRLILGENFRQLLQPIMQSKTS